jgi:tetratricopeptide (TPR) repeat protein
MIHEVAPAPDKGTQDAHQNGKSSLTSAIDAYAHALADLSIRRTEQSPAQGLRILIARDAVARELATSQNITASDLARLGELDYQLRGHASTLHKTVTTQQLEIWHDVIQPAASAWWWALWQPVETFQVHRHPLVVITTVVFFILSLSLVIDMAYRFLSVGTDVLALFGTFISITITVVGASSLVQFQEQAIERWLYRSGFNRRVLLYWKLVASVTLFCVIFAVWLAMPRIARHYHSLGVTEETAGHLTAAIPHFQRAYKLDPAMAEAHYRLGLVYDRVLDYDSAMTEYNFAINVDPLYYEAYNRLARLYIIRNQDVGRALDLLDAALAATRDDRSLSRYALLKNHAWANFVLGNLTLAQRDLQEAVKVHPEEASAHCLLAQVAEKTKAADALDEWARCLDGKRNVPVEAQWIEMAKERLIQAGRR